MPQHYTRSTVSAEAWCLKCNRRTQHRIDDRILGPCLVCIERLENERSQVKTEPQVAQQGFEFGVGGSREP